MKRTYTVKCGKEIKWLLCMLLVPILLIGTIPRFVLAEGNEPEEVPEFTESVEDGDDDPDDPGKEPDDPDDPGEEPDDPAEPEKEPDDPAEPGEEPDDPTESGEEPAGPAESVEEPNDPYESEEEDGEPAEPGEDDDPDAEPAEDDESASTAETGAYANCISGILWLDTDTYGDGIRDAGEQRLEGYTVSLYKAEDVANAVRTTVTDVAGWYGFIDLESGAYVVGVESENIGGTEYLPPAEIRNDNKFGLLDDDFAVACSEPIEMEENTVVTGIDAGVTTTENAAGELPLQMLSVPIGTDGIVVENVAEFKAALANAKYKTIYLGADIAMTSINNNVAGRDLVINGTDPREGGTRHTYTDYKSNAAYSSLRGPCTNITFKDINVYLHNYYGFCRSTGSGNIVVTLDGVKGKAGQFYFGEGSRSTLVIKDSELTLSKTNVYTEELAQNAGTVRFEGTVTVTRTAGASTTIDLFNLVGSSSTVEIADGADVLLDNSGNTSHGDIFYGVTNLTVGRNAKFACYSPAGFCRAASPLTNLTIGQNSDVRFVCTQNHSLSSLYGGAGSTFTMEAGSSFLLYDDETDPAWSVCYFSDIILNSPKSFILLNPSARAIGGAYRPVLTATGVSSIRYYPSSEIANLFDTSTYAYTPSSNYTRWWAQNAPFDVYANTWSGSISRLLTNYSGNNVPAGATGVMESLDNFSASSSVYGVEIYGTGMVCAVTYDGNGADSGTVPGNNIGFPNDLITVQGNTGNLTRTNHAFAGWNTAADGTGTPYSEGDTFAITEDTTLYAQWERNGYTVTEKYVDESTGAAFQDDTFETLTEPPYSYGGLLDDIIVSGDIYIYKGYKVGGYSPGDTPDGTGAPSITDLATDETVYLIYHKVTDTISVTFDTGWDFYVDQDTYPNVETGTMGDSGRYYSFKNESDKPVYVDLTEVREISSGGLSLVADASACTPGSNEYSLRLIPASVALTGTANSFTNTVTGITPGTHTTMRLGELSGRYVRQAAPTSTDGYVAIGGYYAGYLSAEEKNPQLRLTFTFSLIT